MGEYDLQIGDLVSWRPVDWTDLVIYGVIVSNEMSAAGKDRSMYSVYTERKELVHFFQYSSMHRRMKVECR